MAELPSASTIIDDEAGAFAGGTGYAVVLSCVEQNDDLTPRVYTSTKGLLEQHGYSQGVAYAALHIEASKKPVIFVALPTATPGTVGRQNSTGVTGSSAISVSAGSAGFLEETECELEVVTAGTIGTPGIVFEFSADRGRTVKRVRLGDATSWTVPYLGIVINFGAGTLNAGDRYTFVTTPPMWDQEGLADARDALAAQLKLARSFVVIGDLENATFAGYVTTEVNGYETENDRFVYARVSVRDRVPLAAMAKVTKRITGLTLTFAEVGGTGDTITRSSGSWISDGLVVGDTITVAGSVSNNVTGKIAGLTATVITFGTTDLAAEGPVSDCVVTASPTLTFAEVGGTGDTITRSSGSWLADGFRAGDTVAVTGTASNNVSGPIASLSATVLTFGTTDLAAEEIRSDAVTITKGETMAAWVSAMDAAFDDVDDEKRIDLSLGRLRKQCPITGWLFRRPTGWAASVREYQHDVHIPSWRKDDGPLDGWTMEDEDGVLEEYDERVHGGALAARFTCARTWANGPRGAFIALSLTRAPEGSLLSRTHNMAVANLACSVCQAETENAVGQVLEVNDDGTGTPAALAIIESRVNSAEETALLQARAEGKRASSVKWEANPASVLKGPDAELTGALDVVINGTLEKITTRVRIR